MIGKFKEAKTYAILLLIASLGIVIATNNFELALKIIIMVTYWIFINKFQIHGEIFKRIVWNLIFLFTGAAILFLFDLSIPALVLKVISKVPIVGKVANIAAILLKMPEAAFWAVVSIAFGWLAGIIELEEMPAFERQVILYLKELRYR